MFSIQLVAKIIRYIVYFQLFIVIKYNLRGRMGHLLSAIASTISFGLSHNLPSTSGSPYKRSPDIFQAI